jgi:H+/Cl- antiporter ClcA
MSVAEYIMLNLGMVAVSGLCGGLLGRLIARCYYACVDRLRRKDKSS